MIGKLKGIVDSYGEDHVILDVQGVGYVVQCSARTLQRLPKPGEPSALSIETHVREDAIRLYGFMSDNERDWFRLMQMVQGVGAKVALAILSTLDAGALATALATNDKAAIARAPGVGPKLAQRICAELKDKAPAFGHVDPSVATLAGALEDRKLPQAVVDAVSALVNLGYAQGQASAAIAAALAQTGEAAEAKTLIRLGLRKLAR
jgi:Holliday junction DNA helicase RuvA